MTLPLSVYVHFPWCVAKCPYCDFNSFALRGALPETEYVAALVQDLQAQLAVDSRGDWNLASRTVCSVFLGGGTPSLFPPRAIARVLEELRARLPLAADAEITLEANPGTVEHGRFAGYAEAGVNRVSLGAQSFDAEALRRLGRIHGPDDTVRAVEELRAAGIDNFNLDLMYGLPGHDVEAALRDLRAALALAPAHVSHYALTLEPGTEFAARPPADLADHDTTVAMLAACAPLLRAAGFERYEVSAWARPGRRSIHNLNYWQFGDYLGLGAGAHGKLSGRARRDAASTPLETRRTQHARDPRRYMAAVRDAARGASHPATAPVAPADLPFEFMVNGLRLVAGVPAESFTQRTGLASATIEPAVAALRARGLLQDDPAVLAATARGLDFLNDLLVEFLPPSRSEPGCTQPPVRGAKTGDYGAFRPS
jgi:putative oxygen-independent coproporphyrinogen III oxidase